MKQVAGTMKLELAQYREVAAFAQFGSDLDAATQQQLLRGGILTELLKQRQFVPMTTAEIVVSIWAGTRGYLDKFAEKEVLRFESLWLDFVKSSKADTIADITSKKQITPENETNMRNAMEEFLNVNEFEGRAAWAQVETLEGTGGLGTHCNYGDTRAPLFLGEEVWILDYTS